MPVQSIRKVKNLSGKRVLVRVDFNVPLKKNKILDDSRLVASLPTIQFLLEKKAQVILVTHIGRPEGKRVASLSVKPVAKRLNTLLGKDVVVRTKPLPSPLLQGEGSVEMLENIRFFKGEEENDPAFAEKLASLGDIFVLDGFAVAHRASASVVGVTKFLPSYAGLLLEKEIAGLEKVTKKPKPPFTLVLGGAKAETKIPIMKHLLGVVDHALIGGGIANTYLAVSGYDVGKSLVDIGSMQAAEEICRKKKVIVPHDVIVGSMDGKKYRRVVIEKDPHQICRAGEYILDVGPSTIRQYASYIRHAKTLVWNGALGYFEQHPYHHGTLAIARLVAMRSRGKAFGVIGGGETLQAMDMVKMSEYIDLVSTGGGAMLEYLSGKKLPGIVALEKAGKR